MGRAAETIMAHTFSYSFLFNGAGDFLSDSSFVSPSIDDFLLHEIFSGLV